MMYEILPLPTISVLLNLGKEHIEFEVSNKMCAKIANM